MKVCKHCDEPKSPDKMVPCGKAGSRLRALCKQCKVRINKTRRHQNPEDDRRISRAYQQRLRADLSRLPQVIFSDSRRTDKKAQRENNLTKEFIATEIAKGCAYCGESKIRMTPDRIDNSLGHTQGNVVSACLRCNYTRKDMGCWWQKECKKPACGACSTDGRVG